MGYVFKIKKNNETTSFRLGSNAQIGSPVRRSSLQGARGRGGGGGGGTGEQGWPAVTGGLERQASGGPADGGR